MREPTLLLIPPLLHVDALACDHERITVLTHAAAGDAACPDCRHRSAHLHSRYTRTLADLPWGDVPVSLQVTVRRFRCRNPRCRRRIFAERLDEVAVAYARRTDRLAAALEIVAFALGGEAGARLAERLHFPISPDTLLRLIRRAPEAVLDPPGVCGVDDWAWRKGHRYGTILVDLERHRVADLLPDRSAGSFAAWLQTHPSIAVISRDRGEEYVVGARLGAPDALHVADRFHLLKNLGETAERVLKRHVRLLRQIELPRAAARLMAPPRADREAARARTRQRVQDRHAMIHQLVASGLSQRAIVRATGLARGTVRAYLATPTPPERPRVTQRASILTPYVGYLLERWRQGARNALALWREIVALGYPGTQRNVSRFVTVLRRQEAAGIPLTSPCSAGLTPRQAVGLLLTEPAQRTPEQQIAVEQLRALHPESGMTAMLVEEFACLVRHRDEDAEPELAPWMRAATESGIREWRTFVTRLHSDLDAVLAGLQLPWSQGQTEGQILRLKLIRRQMYGRGNFDLVRKRVLRAA